MNGPPERGHVRCMEWDNGRAKGRDMPGVVKWVETTVWLMVMSASPPRAADDGTNRRYPTPTLRISATASTAVVDQPAAPIQGLRWECLDVHGEPPRWVRPGGIGWDPERSVMWVVGTDSA